jgi:hypothetical protein
LWAAGGDRIVTLFASQIEPLLRGRERRQGRVRRRKLKLDLRQPLHDPATGAALLATQRARK